MQKFGGVKFRVKIQIWGKPAIERCCEAIDYRPTEKGLETPQIYPGIDVTIRNKSALRLYGEIALPAQHIPKSCKLVKQRAKLVRLSRHYFSRDL